MTLAREAIEGAGLPRRAAQPPAPRPRPGGELLGRRGRRAHLVLRRGGGELVVSRRDGQVRDGVAHAGAGARHGGGRRRAAGGADDAAAAGRAPRPTGPCGRRGRAGSSTWSTCSAAGRGGSAGGLRQEPGRRAAAGLLGRARPGAGEGVSGWRRACVSALVACAVVRDDPPRVFVAQDIDTLNWVLACQLVAKTPGARPARPASARSCAGPCARSAGATPCSPSSPAPGRRWTCTRARTCILRRTPPSGRSSCSSRRCSRD